MKAMTIKQQIAKFKKETGIRLKIMDGKPYYNGNLCLHNYEVTSLPDNLIIKGSLDLTGTLITSLPNNLIVYRWLTLAKTKITSIPNDLIVGNTLDLRDSLITSLPDNLVVGANLDLRGTKISKLPNGLIVGGWLDLQGTNIETLPNDLIVGNWLCLNNTKITQIPDSIIVGRFIALTNTPMENFGIPKVNHNVPQLLSWRNGEYILCDGIFSKVLSHKGKVWKAQYVPILNDQILYVVTDGNGIYSHGYTIKKAKADLIYKISNRDKSLYKDLTLDSKVTFEQAIVMYRVITGACEFGTKDFVENRLGIKKDKYTVAELIELTKGEYQSDVFEKFFTNKTA